MNAMLFENRKFFINIKIEKINTIFYYIGENQIYTESNLNETKIPPNPTARNFAKPF